MKCFAIKVGDEYVANEHMPLTIREGWYRTSNVTLALEPCIEDSKHYKNKSTANSWVRSNIDRLEGAIKDFQLSRAKQEQELANLKSGNVSSYQRTNTQYYISNTQTRIQSLDEVIAKSKHMLKTLSNAEVVTFNSESPNFFGKFVIRWSKWVDSQYARLGFTVERGNRANQYCPLCGVSLKNLAYVQARGANRICGFCVENMYSTIKPEQDKLPDYIREQYETQTFLRKV